MSVSETDPAEPAVAARPGRRPAVAVALVVLGLLFCLGYRFTISSEPHSFADGATPPSDFALTAGRTYSIGVPNGLADVVQKLPDPSAVSCDITTSGGGRRQLAVTVEPTSSRAINQVATFVAPETGRARIRCSGLPAVFVDNADDIGFDYAGLFLVLASISLAVGFPLLFSELRRRSVEARPRTDHADRPA